MKNDINVPKRIAVFRSFGEKLSKKDLAEVAASVDMAEEFSTAKRAYLIHRLLVQQSNLSESKVEPKNCSLVDLKAGRIVGSNYCKKCSGFLGLQE